jgi:hypothetical protein
VFFSSLSQIYCIPSITKPCVFRRTARRLFAAMPARYGSTCHAMNKKIAEEDGHRATGTPVNSSAPAVEA